MNKPFMERTDEAVSFDEATSEMRDWLLADSSHEHDVTPLPISTDKIRVLGIEDFSADDINRIMRDVPGWVDPRLQQLLAEFEAAREAVACENDADLLGDEIRSFSIEEAALFNKPGSEGYPMGQAARRYIIAHRFNEFEPDRAMAIWKLQKQ